MTSRRAWIAGASGVAVAAAAGAKIALRGVSPARRTGMLAGSRTSLDDVGNKSHSFLLADAHGTVVRRIPLEFQMHGFAWDPLAPERAVLLIPTRTW